VKEISNCVPTFIVYYPSQRLKTISASQSKDIPSASTSECPSSPRPSCAREGIPGSSAPKSKSKLYLEEVHELHPRTQTAGLVFWISAALARCLWGGSAPSGCQQATASTIGSGMPSKRSWRGASLNRSVRPCLLRVQTFGRPDCKDHAFPRARAAGFINDVVADKQAHPGLVDSSPSCERELERER
jgi:hypothetical protein